MSKHTEELMLDSADPRKIYDWKGTIAECNTIRGVEADKANAARLVKAWNMHDELIDALKECVEPLEPGEDCGLPVPLYNKVCELIKQSEQ